MKHLPYAITLTFFVIGGCAGDSDEAVTPTTANQVAYDSTPYSLKNGLANDYRTIDSDNHYNIDFSVSDRNESTVPSEDDDDEEEDDDDETEQLLFLLLELPGRVPNPAATLGS